MQRLVVLLSRALAAAPLRSRPARAADARAADAARRRLLFLAEASAELTRSLDYETTLNSLARLPVPEVADLCIVDMVAGRGRLRRAAVASSDARTESLAWEMASRRPLGLGGSECVPAVIGTGAPHLHPDLAAEAGATGIEPPEHAARLRELGITSAMVVPLVIRGQTLGAISLGSAAAGRHYRSDDVAFAEELARRAALALDNARLFGESQARLRESEALLAVGRTLSSTLDPTEQMRRVAREIARALSADMVGAFLADPAHQFLHPIAGYHVPRDLVDKFIHFPIPIKGHLAIEEAWTRRRAVWTSEMPTDPRVDRESFERFPHQSDLFVPMVARGKPVGGFFVIWWQERRRFTPEEVRLVEGICDQAGILVDNARLYSEATRRQREAEELTRLARRLTESLDTPAVAERVVEGAMLLLGGQGAVLRRLEPDGSLTLVASAGERPPTGALPVMAAGRGVVGRAVSDGVPVWSADLEQDPGVRIPDDRGERLGAHGPGACLAVPLRLHDEILGVLAVGGDSARAFSPEEMTVLQTFADQAALALENARLYQRAQAAYEELSRAQAQLVRAETLRALGELASGAAHHLNNLLTVILGRVQLARERQELPEIRRSLGVAERATLDAAEVVRRMARVSRAHTVTGLVTLDLNEVVQEVLELTRPRWHDEAVVRGLRIEARAELEPLPPILGHPPSLREALMNLILNAIDALTSDGGIVVKTWTTGERVYCAVADTGTGMPEMVQRRALEPFFSTKGLRSTGLGLSVTYGIIQRSGGELTIDSTEGRGTTVTFNLPVASTRDEPPGPLTAAPIAPLRVLLIDDETIVRTTVADILSNLGATVIEAQGGREGLALLEQDSSVDLVLTDLGMPGMTGWAVARAIKARHPLLLVGLLTGWGEDPEASPDDRVTVDFTLTKPVTVAALRAAIARLRPPRLTA
jgi:GAF domain-containing protein/CheY-like chemotaxis protein/anti-sigma regulatory factor (Ser/Thr protein kinase)